MRLVSVSSPGSAPFGYVQVFPTDTRAFFHGISAAAGKLGAILAASVFSHVRNQGGRRGFSGSRLALPRSCSTRRYSAV